MSSSAIILHGLCHVMLKAGEGRHSMLSAQTGKHSREPGGFLKVLVEQMGNGMDKSDLKKMNEREHL